MSDIDNHQEDAAAAAENPNPATGQGNPATVPAKKPRRQRRKAPAAAAPAAPAASHKLGVSDFQRDLHTKREAFEAERRVIEGEVEVRKRRYDELTAMLAGIDAAEKAMTQPGEPNGHPEHEVADLDRLERDLRGDLGSTPLPPARSILTSTLEERNDQSE